MTVAAIQRFMTDPPEIAASILRERFGHAAFRPGQAEIVAAMCAGRDVLAVLPTGAGKSICFQVPALAVTRPTIVVSPLIALMADQVANLRRRGVAAAAITSLTTPTEREATLAALRGAGPFLLYVAPERLTTPRFLRSLEGVRPVRVVVDEAHCISEWGHDFRPAYLAIGTAVTSLGRPPVAAFTATATPATRTDIVTRLALRRPNRFLASVDRPNLRWEVERARRLPDGLEAVLRAVDRRGEGAAIVYAATRSLAVGVAAALRTRGHPALGYHAGLSPERRAAVQASFLASATGIVCATCAFGMGIDHPAVRLVAHLGMPGALESYVQEAGRAGRDGAPGRCLLVTLPGDVALHRNRIRELRRRARPAARARLAAMRAYAAARTCRRRSIARYFGEPSPPCAGCDRCGPTGRLAGSRQPRRGAGRP